MVNTEIVLQVPQEGIQKATQELGDVRLMLVDYELEAKRIKVETPEQYAEAGELLKRVRDAKKKAAWVMNPLKSITKTIAEKFRTMEQAELNLGERIEGILEPKMVDFKRREREAAAAEERRINEEKRREAARLAEEQRKREEAAAEEKRKAREKEIAAQLKAGEIKKREAEKLKKEAERQEEYEVDQAAEEAQFVANDVQEVKVEASTPKVAGLRQRINWTFKVVDATKIPRSFLMPDEASIGRFVRSSKDKALAEKTIPGIEVWSEDAI
jgi:hypothetical protein